LARWEKLLLQLAKDQSMIRRKVPKEKEGEQHQDGRARPLRLIRQKDLRDVATTKKTESVLHGRGVDKEGGMMESGHSDEMSGTRATCMRIDDVEITKGARSTG
jgi:hypothetical protein